MASGQRSRVRIEGNNCNIWMSFVSIITNYDDNSFMLELKNVNVNSSTPIKTGLIAAVTGVTNG